MPALLPISVTGDLTDIPGVPGSLVPPQNVVASITPTVLAMGKPVNTFGSIVAPHGNPYDPRKPGFDPVCASATVSTLTAPTVLIQGKPVAVVGPALTGSTCTCGHAVLGPGVPTILVGRA